MIVLILVVRRRVAFLTRCQLAGMTSKLAGQPAVATEISFGKQLQKFMIRVTCNGAAVTHASWFVLGTRAGLARVQVLSDIALFVGAFFEFARQHFLCFLFQRSLLFNNIQSCYDFLIGIAISHCVCSEEYQLREGEKRRQAFCHLQSWVGKVPVGYTLTRANHTSRH